MMLEEKLHDVDPTSQSTKSHLASHPRNAIKPHPIYNITSPHMLLECLFRPSDHSTVPRSDCPTNQPSDRPTIRSSDRRLTMANHGYPCFFMVIHGYLRLYMCLRVVYNMHHSAQSSAVDCYHSAQSSAVVLTIPTALPCYTTRKIMYFSQVQGKINDNKVT